MAQNERLQTLIRNSQLALKINRESATPKKPAVPVTLEAPSVEATQPAPKEKRAEMLAALHTMQVDKTRTKKQISDDYFKMKQTPLTDEVKRDLHILQNRHVLDPKRHYKRQDKGLPKVFQMGEIVAAADDFSTGRLTRKERQVTIVDELLNDQKARAYMKRRMAEVHAKRSNVTRGGTKRARK
ncbi:hypothetical protein HDU91_005026 [Kappamyces sp. JEL0680]|nr:hypothetical protein HDU91_005026 [Kappamyces sp. JEL0680]